MAINKLFSINKPQPVQKQTDVAELIKRRRRQILVHSYIYYELDQNIISDSQWSAWAIELEELQNKYPDIASKVEFADDFKGFDHSTGQNLRIAYSQPSIVSAAERLIRFCCGRFV